jgi:Tol biopolymer transport system component
MVYELHQLPEYPSLVLWDLETSQELWRLKIDGYLLHSRPQWSPDGTRFAIGIPPELYGPVFELLVVDRDGQAKQLTHLEEAGFEYDTRIYHATWSPDERYIAFWLVDYLTGSGTLAVYDTETETVTDYCIPLGNPLSFPPYWSPDSKQLVFDSSADFYGPYQVVVLDIVENRAVEIAGDGYRAVGWMVVAP